MNIRGLTSHLWVLAIIFSIVGCPLQEKPEKKLPVKQPEAPKTTKKPLSVEDIAPAKLIGPGRKSQTSESVQEESKKEQPPKETDKVVEKSTKEGEKSISKSVPETLPALSAVDTSPVPLKSEPSESKSVPLVNDDTSANKPVRDGTQAAEPSASFKDDEKSAVRGVEPATDLAPGMFNPLRNNEPSPDVKRPEPIKPDVPLPAVKSSPDQTPASASATTKSNAPTRSRPLAAKLAASPFDPIKENGPIFVGWPKPEVALIITGMEHGYLEPCGCAGLDRMKGGMARRYSLFEQLRKNGWPVVGLDVGGLANGFGRQAEMKYQTLVESKRKMGYDVLAFGVEDLRLPAGELVAVAAGVDGKASLFVSANIGLFGFDSGITPTSRIINAGKMKIGVTAILGKTYQQEIRNDEIEFSDPETALKKIVPELKRNAELLVLLAHATQQESLEIARKFPEFSIIVISDGPPEPPAQPEKLPGTNTLAITVGHKGMTAIVLGMYADKTTRYQRVPLDSRFPSAPEMKLLMAGYQDQLRAIGFAGLGLREMPHPLASENGTFVGSKKCEACHEKSYKIWKKSGHHLAFETLKKLDPPRDADPECISCHVTGWHPTKYFPYKSGFESEAKTPHLVDVGCEACHGPGEKHVAAEMGANTELQNKYRKAVVVTKSEAKKQQCVSCHDLDNSPDFDFEQYWPFIEHYEKESE